MHWFWILCQEVFYVEKIEGTFLFAFIKSSCWLFRIPYNLSGFKSPLLFQGIIQNFLILLGLFPNNIENELLVGNN
jgi:hypothetical protein